MKTNQILWYQLTFLCILEYVFIFLVNKETSIISKLINTNKLTNAINVYNINSLFNFSFTYKMKENIPEKWNKVAKIEVR